MSFSKLNFLERINLDIALDAADNKFSAKL